MHRYLTICALLVSACGGSEAVKVVPETPVASADLFEPCSGWLFGPPASERELAEAAEAEQGGRRCANAKLHALREIYGPQ
jgi:hypothetical protein